MSGTTPPKACSAILESEIVISVVSVAEPGNVAPTEISESWDCNINKQNQSKRLTIYLRVSIIYTKCIG